MNIQNILQLPEGVCGNCWNSALMFSFSFKAHLLLIHQKTESTVWSHTLSEIQTKERWNWTDSKSSLHALLGIKGSYWAPRTHKRSSATVCTLQGQPASSQQSRISFGDDSRCQIETRCRRDTLQCNGAQRELFDLCCNTICFRSSCALWKINLTVSAIEATNDKIHHPWGYPPMIHITHIK